MALYGSAVFAVVVAVAVTPVSSDGRLSPLGVIMVVLVLLGTLQAILGRRTTVRADPDGLTVTWPWNSRRRVRWSDVARFEGTMRPGLRRDLLVVVKRNGWRVFLGLPEGHHGLMTYWESVREQHEPDRHFGTNTERAR